MTGDPASAPARQKHDREAWAEWVSTAARLVLAAVWAWAGLSKVANPTQAVFAVRAYRLLPETLVHVVAWGLPFVELALAVLLLVGLRTRVSAVVSSVLLGAFLLAVSSAWVRGLRIECGCFGGGGYAAGVTWRSYALEIGRDVALLGASCWLAIRPRSRLAIEEV
jgi:uncharacterized membrane protein YphA (DoxX/SURF4 family)